MIVAAIPVKDNLKWTAPLVMSLLLGDEVDEVWIYDNGSTDATKYWVKHQQQLWTRLKYTDASQMRFYEMWNHMIKRGAETSNTHLAILNNDIRLPHMALKTMSNIIGDHAILTIDPDKKSFDPIEDVRIQAIKWWRHRIGWAFMVNCDIWRPIEEPIDVRFNIWYGDDYLYRTALERGWKIGVARGVGCDHAVSQTPISGDRDKLIDEDYRLFYGTWNEL